MNKKELFIKMVEAYLKEGNDVLTSTEMEAAIAYFEEFKKGKTKTSKGEITEAGKNILKIMIDNIDKEILTAKEIGALGDINSRSISGSIRKLIADGYVEVVDDSDPKKYSLTETGKALTLD
ncbi:MAG: hypothetical protein HUJ68_02205 [Clostridia bacterium]|nr:hypothetical protein [Clostridia bacterium]